MDKADADRQGNAPVMLTVSYHGERFRISTEEKCHVSNWKTPKKGLPYVGTGEPLSDGVNENIEKLELAVKAAWREIGDGFVRGEEKAFKARFKELSQRKRWPARYAEKPAVPTFAEFVKKYQEEHKTRVSQSWLRQYNSFRDQWLKFKPDVTWSDFTMPTFNQWINFLAGECDLIDSTIESKVKKVRVLMDYAEICGVPVPKDYRLLEFNVPPSARPWLSWEEVMHLNGFKFKSEQMDLTAGRFLMACFTGYRFSDLVKLDGALEQRQGFRVFNLFQRKTGEAATVAMNDYAEEVWERYGGMLFEGFAKVQRHDFSADIKKVAQAAGLDAPFRMVEHRAGVAHEELLPKWQVLSPHAGRHTFAVNSIEKGMPLEVLKDILGHKSISSTEVYARIVESFKHQTMRTVWKKPVPVQKVAG
jgi:site-specific recombinase XerD